LPNTWSGDEHSYPLTKEGATKTEQAIKGLKRIGVAPHLGQTAALVLFGNHSLSLSFKKAGSALIAFHENTIIGQGMLEWWIPPAQLRALRKG
jgi:phosphohistidine phosphatase SixA